MLESIKSERLISAVQAKALDVKAEKEFGIPTLLLMENAGRAVCEEALKVIKSAKKRIAIFCGTGNNGGDGFCCARHLLACGIKPSVYLAGKVDDVKHEAGVNLNILLRMKQKITGLSAANINLLKKNIGSYDVIIDALLGVGLKGEIRGVYLEVINMINSSGAYVLSVDIPSGLDATSGAIPGGCIRADKTVTFVAKKRGMVSGAGKKYCGKIVTRSIGAML